MGNIVCLMFLSHKYNCYSHHRHATCPGRRENDPCDNKLDHCHFVKVRKKRKFKTMEKMTSPQCCYFFLLYGYEWYAKGLESISNKPLTEICSTSINKLWKQIFKSMFIHENQRKKITSRETFKIKNPCLYSSIEIPTKPTEFKVKSHAS